VLEPHSWLPFISWLPRRAMLPVLRAARRYWPRRTQPDWYLLNRREMASLFADAEIRTERWLGLTKSIMAVKSETAPPKPRTTVSRDSEATAGEIRTPRRLADSVHRSA
jgi:hypothetical protein